MVSVHGPSRKQSKAMLLTCCAYITVGSIIWAYSTWCLEKPDRQLPSYQCLEEPHHHRQLQSCHASFKAANYDSVCLFVCLFVFHRDLCGQNFINMLLMFFPLLKPSIQTMSAAGHYIKVSHGFLTSFMCAKPLGLKLPKYSGPPLM